MPSFKTEYFGPNLFEIIAPENRKKVLERVLDPNIVTGKYKLKELLDEMALSFILNDDKLVCIC